MSDTQPPEPHALPRSDDPSALQAPATAGGVPGAAVPPPNPHAFPRQPAGRGMAGAAMALGLIALLTAVVSALYLSRFLIVAGIIGALAVVLGTIALVRRQPRTPGLIGVVAGAIAIIAALVVGALSVTTAVTSAGETGGGTGSSESGAADAAEDGSSGDVQPVQWARNMASGGIVFSGGDATPLVAQSDALPDGSAPLDPDEVEFTSASGEPQDHIQLYVDYRCPICAMFEAANQSTLESAVLEGGAALQVRPLTFLDRVSSDAYSSRASGAMACIVDSEPEHAWEAHAALLSTDFQPSEQTAGHSNATLVEGLDAAVGGLGDEARSCIEEERFVPLAQALNDWSFSNPVPYAEDPDLMVTGTPFAVVNGVAYEGSPDDADAFRAFLEQQGVELG